VQTFEAKANTLLTQPTPIASCPLPSRTMTPDSRSKSNYAFKPTPEQAHRSIWPCRRRALTRRQASQTTAHVT
jgi:hypothetical protein